MAREEAVRKAVNEGTVNVKNKDEVKRIRKGIPKVRFIRYSIIIMTIRSGLRV